MVISVIFSASYACHPSPKLGYPFRTIGKDGGDQTLTRPGIRKNGGIAFRDPSPEEDGRPLRRFFISPRSMEIIRQALPLVVSLLYMSQGRIGSRPFHLPTKPKGVSERSAETCLLCESASHTRRLASNARSESPRYAKSPPMGIGGLHERHTDRCRCVVIFRPD